MMRKLGVFCTRHRLSVVLGWLVALVVIGAVGNGVVGPKFSSRFEIPASESASGFEVLSEHFGNVGSGQTGALVFSSTMPLSSPANRAAIEAAVANVDALDHVSVASPFISGTNAVSQNGRVAFATLNLDPALDQRELADLGRMIEEQLPQSANLDIELAGQALASVHPPASELIGLAFAVIILILAFGSVLAMGLSIGVAVVGVGIGASVVALVSNLTTVPDFATTLGAMLGIAVGIDYSLFILTRFRENRTLGYSDDDAIIAAMDTAGRAVLFAGATVVISLLGMLLIGLKFISGLGIGASIAVAVTMLASLTLLPACLSYAASKIETTRRRGIIAASLVALALLGAGLSITPLLFAAPLAAVVLVAGFAVPMLKRPLQPRRTKELRETLAYRWSRLIQRRPVASLLTAGLILMLLAAPVFSLRLGFSDEGNFPKDTTTRRAYDLLATGFGPGFNGPFVLTGTLQQPSDIALLEQLRTAISADPGVVFVSPVQPSASGQAFVMQIIPTDSPQDQETVETVQRLRADVIPQAAPANSEVFLTGATAASIDFTSYLTDRLVLFIAVVLLLSFLLLMMVFRSVLVPVKAVLMNVLSIAAAYGVVVAVFQWGWGSGLLNVEPAPIEPFVPMMMFAILFGLSMDYEVFLLSRVKEEYDRTLDPRSSVADGLAATARVITAAAAIMIVVFGAFLLEDTRIIKLFGVGLAVAVLLDATLVRMVLVPSTMELLGARNWWLPAFLERVLPHLNVEGPAYAQASANTVQAQPDADAAEDPDADPQADQPAPSPGVQTDLVTARQTDVTPL
jgi:RND superfamily putative drug exporter